MPVLILHGARDARFPVRRAHELRALLPNSELAPFVSGPDVPGPAARWQVAVHDPGLYDLEVDTAESPPGDCAIAIRRQLDGPPATALARLAGR